MWGTLSIFARAFATILLCCAAYSATSLARVALHLYKCRGNFVIGSPQSLAADLLAAAGKLQAQRQLHTLLLLAFGLCATNEASGALRSILLSESTSLGRDAIPAFDPLIGLAFVTFFALIALHSFQWAVTTRLHTISSQSQR